MSVCHCCGQHANTHTTECVYYHEHPVPELIEFLDKGKAAELHRGGYICISNKYLRVGRSDRADWHIAMAEYMRCAPADFYLRDGSGKLCPRWHEHYVRCHTKDTLVVSEAVYQALKKLGE